MNKSTTILMLVWVLRLALLPVWLLGYFYYFAEITFRDGSTKGKKSLGGVGRWVTKITNGKDYL
jgi:hypothetical protein